MEVAYCGFGRAPTACGGDRRAENRSRFLSVEALLQLAAQGNTVLDPLSTLISTSVKVGRGNLFYPQVVLEAHSGTLVLGDENCLYPQTFILAEQGQLSVGHRNVFGEGGVTLKTSVAGERLVVEDEGRYN